MYLTKNFYYNQIKINYFNNKFKFKITNKNYKKNQIFKNNNFKFDIILLKFQKLNKFLVALKQRNKNKPP